jgi:hypothetical protein
VVPLGRDDGGTLLLRFEAALPAQANVLEAYLLLERAGEADEDPGLVALHASRVVEPWTGSTVTWAAQPRLADDGGPVTRVAHGSTGFVRLDVRDIVNRWRLRGRGDYGVAIVAEGTTPTGLGFAMLPATSGGGSQGVAGEGPRLEVYVK